MYLLDTNTVSELRSGKRGQSEAVRAWAAQVRPNQLFLSSITVLEIEIGIQLLENRHPPQGQAIRTWFENVRRSFAGRILAFSEDTAVVCARLHVPDPRSSYDSMIAATAIEHGFTVVTRNVKDFERTGVQLLNPWSFV
ncbi:type II toxin-antitoxin system VapC family toxin [Lampropedia hyalina]|jgi:predicted nucleic acid-binding protein|uniref:type II toxin-antitoxin system VapC family toxin n=1 Tax=Lampropedia hyalina TaxID=198706 RepID=UPI000932105F|nr:type II toxin-antitoxin system VapC family toxin [Lampropedia hyalina]